jgi:hypothetical protein
MPGFDRTGPWGYGPMTGRGLGPCGRGLARGFGRGRGMMWAPSPGYAPAYAPTREQELADLRAEKELVERELEEIKARLTEIEKKK